MAATFPAGQDQSPATADRRAANLRADAQRNRAKILAAVVTAISKDPEASVARIATEAGVGRMTLYGHFRTRSELIEAALVDTLERGDEVLRELQLEGDTREALQQLIASSWALIDRSRALLTAAQKELPAARIRELHDKAEARMGALLKRGQIDGALRADLPVSWLLSVTYAVMNGAAEEVRAGRLDAQDAPVSIEAILLPAFTNTAPHNGSDDRRVSGKELPSSRPESHSG